MLLSINPDNPQARLVSHVAQVLGRGGVIAYPTDTTYGIGCSIFSKKGIERIYLLKQREKKKPFSFICSELSEVARYAKVSNYAYRILKRYLPGPYTFVIDATSVVPDLLVTKQKTVGIRIPDNRICIALVKELGHPIVTTSANLSGEEPIGDPLEVERTLGKQLDLVVDGGNLTADVSSVVSLIGDYPQVLRRGIGDVSWCGE
ncbi:MULTISPECIES: L-threonylcarbamoyladenylate synthase [Geobacter]|uniref:Translation factor Sua5 n=2 Tax=Geobacter TaxID=28231 RepID=A0A0C1QPA2_9BACT|nr:MULTISPECIES: L-threonylcarbamoyladenylate synthase [Geobacter]ANA40410.1 threonylcarbamoyl-AMP synthase [Geobacter anodireducens]KIE42422.1 translation factor Sua5 [Geobacter soli]MBE2887140.1 threonylcarbamoyl-AMP synthase [Geobacter anodireducens]HMN01286.1 L-threonylcarbamoyladenylate synthase [Geobacter anodireducens]